MGWDGGLTKDWAAGGKDLLLLGLQVRQVCLVLRALHSLALETDNPVRQLLVLLRGKRLGLHSCFYFIIYFNF